MKMERPELLDQAALLADVTRCRLLLLLESQELTVSELRTTLQLPQSTVSRHLKALRDRGWIDSRRDGTRRFYGSAIASLRPAEQRLWMLIRDSLADSSLSQSDVQRLERRASIAAERFNRHMLRTSSSLSFRPMGYTRSLALRADPKRKD